MKTKIYNVSTLSDFSTIIEILKNRRIELGISQSKLAKLSGISQTMVARIELYKTYPKLDTLIKLFMAVDMKINLELEKLVKEKNLNV